MKKVYTDLLSNLNFNSLSTLFTLISSKPNISEKSIHLSWTIHFHNNSKSTFHQTYILINLSTLLFYFNIFNIKNLQKKGNWLFFRPVMAHFLKTDCLSNPHFHQFSTLLFYFHFFINKHIHTYFWPWNI